MTLEEKVAAMIGTSVQRPNWDSYGAEPIATATIEAARTVARRLEGMDLTVAVPVNDGSIVLINPDETITIKISTDEP